MLGKSQDHLEQEKEDTYQSSLIILRDSYRSGLYLFGFIKIVNGKHLEKAFWAASMLLILSFTFYMVYRNGARYAAYGVSIKKWEDDTPQRRLPVITLCLTSTFDYNLNCYNNLYSCYEVQNPRVPSSIDMFYWNSSEWVKGKYLGNNCYVLNENGTIQLSVDSEHQRVKVELNDNSNMKGDNYWHQTLHILFQSTEDYRNRKEYIYATQYFQTMRLSPGIHEIYIREKHIKSLQAPYTSNCTDENVVSNMFSDKYTHDSCQETCAYHYMYQKCNDTIDMWKKYNTKVKQIDSTTSLENCFKEVINKIKFRKFPDCICGRPCKESIYTATPTSESRFNHDWIFSFYIKDAAIKIELVPDYPFEAFMGSLGGVLGLGGKIMATLQLVIFLSLCIAHFRMR